MVSTALGPVADRKYVAADSFEALMSGFEDN
jgi:hypothetical protein